VFDSHCHLTDERLRDEVGEVMMRAHDAGVIGVVSIASDARDGLAAHDLAVSRPDIWSTAGIHPHAAGAATSEDRDIVRELIARDRVVALGEAGLDYFYDTSPRDIQREMFAWHLDLSAQTGLPVVVHSRDAEEDTAALIREADPRATGVLHCFAAGSLLFDTAMERGWYVSFGGMVTFKNFALTDFVRAVPEDKLLLETDSPYLAPVPMRGKRNEPAFVAYTCNAVASIRGVDSSTLGAQTEANARRFYGIAP
jgi:TatD DNase family protein